MHMLTLFLKLCLDNEIMMIEADVSMGRLIWEDETVPIRPIMAHPLWIQSDITLEDFVEAIILVLNKLCVGLT